MSKNLVQMTAELIQAQISSKQMSNDEIQASLNETFLALKRLQDSESSGELVPSGKVETTPASGVDPKKSIQRHKILCLECGAEFKMLSGKHLALHGLTAAEYRKKHGFKARQPLCAKALSEKRSTAGKERGVPENLRIAIEAKKAKRKRG